jgi:hypothetical protein
MTRIGADEGARDRGPPISQIFTDLRNRIEKENGRPARYLAEDPT